MNNKLIEVLNDFANELAMISPKKIENMEIVLPYDNYKQLEFEMNGMRLSYNVDIYGKPKNLISVLTLSGINFNISCKELNDVLIEAKLKECFKILSK